MPVIARLNDQTGRLDPRGVPPHNDLEGLDGHAPSSTGQPAGLIPRTTGDGEYVLVPEPAVDPGTSEGRVLAATKVAPAVVTDYLRTNSGSYEDALFAVTFTVPASGNIMIDLEATVVSNGTNNQHSWLMRDVNGPVVGTRVPVDVDTAPRRKHATIIVTGLTPGQTLTWSWGVLLPTSLQSTLKVAGTETHDPAGPALMVVRDAPF